MPRTRGRRQNPNIFKKVKEVELLLSKSEVIPDWLIKGTRRFKNYFKGYPICNYSDWTALQETVDPKNQNASAFCCDQAIRQFGC